MNASPRLSFFRLGLVALAVFAVTPYLHSQSMMLRNNHSNFGGIAINRGDFNGDGILDIVTANNSTSSVSVYFGRADGTFAAPIDTNTGLPASDLALGDFNNDGKLDIAISNNTGRSAQVLLGNGNGTFQPAELISLDGQAVSITASDFNNDGKVDLAIGITQFGSLILNEIEVLQGDGAGHFALAATLGLGGTNSLVSKIRVGDFNKDGKVDIAVLQQQELNAWFGNGNFTFEQHRLAEFPQANDMNTGDLNQDGFTDILISTFDGGSTGSASTGGVLAFLGTPTHNFVSQNAILSSNFSGSSATYGSPSEMIAADVNGDGINDIVALDDDASSQNGVYIWLGTATGGFQPTPVRFIYTTDRNKVAMVAGDFNRDGKIDFAATLLGNSTMEVLLNATPRAACQKNASDPSMTVCQPQEATFSNSPLHIVAKGTSSKTVTDINVYVDNVLKGQFAASSIDQLFTMPTGSHFVVVKGFDSTGASFRSDRHVTIYTGAAGQTCPTSSTGLSINICLPAQNATLHSPVQIFANAYSPRPITAIQVYIDNQLVFNDTTASEVNKLFSMSLGSHFIVVKFFDANGNQINSSRTITVQ
jgi:hypothetical protein